MAYEAFRRDVRLWLQAPVVELVRQGDRVCGAIVERNGTRVRIAARRGVVLACGGFPGSEALTRQLYPHLIEGRNHQRLPPAGNTGDGLRLAQSVGGRLESDVHHPAAWAPVSLVPKEGGRTVPFPHFFERGKPGYIAVDRRGRRFVNEAQSYHVFVPAMIEACRGDSDVAAWIVCDHRAIRGFGLGALGPAPMRIAPHLASGYILRGATPAELAQKAGIDPAGLEATIATFNTGATHGEDREFGRGGDAYQRFNGAPGHQPNPCLAPLATPPYYAVRVVPGELGTFAGIGTDRHGRVLGPQNVPVAGLYAVGNDAVSVMGGTYPGAGITIGPAMTFGYIAACHIAEDATA
jgi:succinate dehydrogenase/fumarate reductase flavoprotein subunit